MNKFMMQLLRELSVVKDPFTQQLLLELYALALWAMAYELTMVKEVM